MPQELTTFTSSDKLPALTAAPGDVAESYRVAKEIAKLPQLRIPIVHSLHGGVYTRTAKIPAGATVVSVMIDTETTVLAHGDWQVWQDGQWITFEGFQVIPGAVGRRQIARALTDCVITMLFPSNAMTVDEAEQEMSHEFAMLQSQDGQPDIVINTHKDRACQEFT